ncbi:MAG: hypothetical protein RL322_3099 [Pseudomonadota bacterium]|jgi:hypothetical protein
MSGRRIGSVATQDPVCNRNLMVSGTKVIRCSRVRRAMHRTRMHCGRIGPGMR